MIFRIGVAAVAVVLFVVTYIAASVVAWVLQGLAGLDHASPAGISIGLMLGHVFSLAMAVLAAVAVVRTALALRRRLRRGHSDR